MMRVRNNHLECLLEKSGYSHFVVSLFLTLPLDSGILLPQCVTRGARNPGSNNPCCERIAAHCMASTADIDSLL